MPRPLPSFHGFIGQPEIVQSAKRLVEGCVASGKPFPNTLLTGPSGIGKTQLCESIALAFGTNLHYVLGGREVRRINICELLGECEHGDILFLDECHALRADVQEVVYPAIDKRQTLRVDGKGKNQTLTDQWRRIAPITIIAATDRPGDLRNALRRRLPQTYTLLTYTDRELREIVAVRAAQIGVLLTPQARGALAGVCRGTPRTVRHLLERLSLYYPNSGESTLTQRDVREFLKGEGIDDFGLSETDRAYLHVLAGREGRLVSLNSIAISIGHDADYVVHEIEGYLVRLGFVSVERGGRMLTEKGMEVAKKRARR